MQKRAEGIASSRAGAIACTTVLALPVGAVLELHQRRLDLGEVLAEVAGDRVDLTPLRGDLARVGEALVEVEVRGPGRAAQLLRAGW